MLISRKHQMVVLNLNNPDRVLSVIPTAKTFEFRGETLVAVPHRLEETKVLHNLGFKVEHPVRCYYDFPTSEVWKLEGKKPMAHQFTTVEFMTWYMRCFNLNDMGTGKTLCTLWAFDYLKKQGLAHKMLVASPLSTLERTWADECFEHFPHLRVVVVYADGVKKRIKLLEQDADIYVINHHGLKMPEISGRNAWTEKRAHPEIENKTVTIKHPEIKGHLDSRPDIDVLVIDELAQVARNAQTDMWESLDRVARSRLIVWGLTGEPDPEDNPSDAWGQCRLVNPSKVPEFYSQFRDMVMRKAGPFKWVPREGAKDLVARAMQPAVRFKRSECVDLPETVFMTRHVELSKEQKKLYDGMMNKLRAEFEDGSITAANEAVKMGKLLQISAGSVYGDGEDPIIIPSKERMELVLELIKQYKGKFLLFAAYTSILQPLHEFLAKHGLRTGIIHGGVSKTKRDDIFSALQKDASLDGILAQPEAMAHGLTLTAANVVIWYGPVHKQGVTGQANARVSRPGQKQTQFIINIESSPIERRIYDRIKKKKSASGALLEMFECVSL